MQMNKGLVLNNELTLIPKKKVKPGVIVCLFMFFGFLCYSVFTNDLILFIISMTCVLTILVMIGEYKFG